MNKEEVLKLALEALERCVTTCFDQYAHEQVMSRPEHFVNQAITAIKKALAQPEQCQCPNCRVTLHASDCAVHSGPAYPAGGCDCGAQPEQEPVAWMFQHDETGRMNYVSNDGIHDPTMFLGMNPRYALVCPLYTTPPQRTWVGLTNEEIDKTLRVYEQDYGWISFAKAIEAKLKEKNV